MNLPVIQCTDSDGVLNCGACCMTVGVPPFPDSPRLPVGEERPCSAFDLNTKRCGIYETRPPACRDFAIGGQACQKYRSRFTDTGSASLP